MYFVVCICLFWESFAISPGNPKGSSASGRALHYARGSITPNGSPCDAFHSILNSNFNVIEISLSDGANVGIELRIPGFIDYVPT